MIVSARRRTTIPPTRKTAIEATATVIQKGIRRETSEADERRHVKWPERTGKPVDRKCRCIHCDHARGVYPSDSPVQRRSLRPQNDKRACRERGERCQEVNLAER